MSLSIFCCLSVRLEEPPPSLVAVLAPCPFPLYAVSQPCPGFPGKGTHSHALQGQTGGSELARTSGVMAIGAMLLAVRPGRSTPQGTTRGPVQAGHPQISAGEDTFTTQVCLYLPEHQDAPTTQAIPQLCPERCAAPGRWCR